MIEKYQFVSHIACANPDCPVKEKQTITARSDGKDDYKLFSNSGLAKLIFGEQLFAACPQCHSHTRVIKLE